MMIAKTPAAVEELYRVPENGKAEIVNGDLITMIPTGARPGRAGGEIHYSLRRYEDQFDGGYALPDNVGFLVDLPRRTSFSPDVAWYVGDVEAMDFLPGAPAFAVEVRSKSDYGPQEERAILNKIEDYFAAGTQVVWDVDLLHEEVILKYSRGDPSQPTVFRRGDTADAEPAVPGWRMPVDQLFKKKI